MKIALSAKITCDPKRILQSRWVHDTAHIFLHSIIRARMNADARARNRKH